MQQKSIFFLGIGGIGMSALARYMRANDFCVAGYDRTRSIVTDALKQQNIDVVFFDSEKDIPDCFRDSETTLVVYTPAIPANHPQLQYFKAHGFKIIKRAELLGMLTSPENGKRALCVAGTHGKTTTSTILAHLLYSSKIGCDAFLGGISNNYKTNVLMDHFAVGQRTADAVGHKTEISNNFVVAEADEYDRSFLQLQPYMAVLTNCEADHLDIYGTEEAYKEAFAQFAEKLVADGILLRHTSVSLREIRKDIKQYTYQVCDRNNKNEIKADFYADNLRFDEGRLYFDFHSKLATLENLCLGVPLLVAAEDSAAAIAIALLCGVEKDEIYSALATYNGVYRRFNVLYNKRDIVYIDDYAHHPTELSATIRSARLLYPEKRIVGIFQPHLYTRTRDFADDFAKALSELDEVVLMPIYPAREEPIEGIDSDMLARKIKQIGKQAIVLEKEELLNRAEKFSGGVLLTLGAGNIENLREPLRQRLEANSKE